MQAQSYKKKKIPSQSRNSDSVTHENNPLHCEHFTHGLFLWSKAVPMKTGQWGLWIIQNNRDSVSGKTHSCWSCINNFFATWRQWNKLSTSSSFDCCVIIIVTILTCPSDAEQQYHWSRARVQMMNLSPTDADILMLYFFLYDHTNGGVRLLIDWKLAN